MAGTFNFEEIITSRLFLDISKKIYQTGIRMKFSALALFLISSFYFLFSPSFVSAQSYNNPVTVAQNQYAAPSTNPDVPNNLHNYTQNVLLEVMAAVSCQLTGIDPVNPRQKCLGVDQKTGKIGFVENGGGAVGVMGNLITMTFTPPIHTADYVRNLAQNFGIIKPAYAFITDGGGGGPPASSSNGIGLQGILPLLNIWAAFRNIVYLLFVLVFVIVGVAIMLRVKIDPRTVMTIQNQIPKLIIGILLVTFSFAIAGFLIDLMYVFIFLIFGIISGIPNADVSQLSPSNLQGGNPFNAAGGLGGIGSIAGHASGGIGNMIASLFDGKIGNVIGAIIGGLIGGGVSMAIPVVGWIAAIPITLLGVGIGTSAGGAALGYIGSFIAFIVISVALLWALFRLWFALLSAYIYILLDIILAPFWVVAGLFPGSQISFNTWVRDIVANLAAFPATIAIFLLAKVFMDTIPSAKSSFAPPLIGNPGDYKSFAALIGLGIILVTPNIVHMIKAALKAPKLDLSSVGQAVGIGASYPVSVGKGIGQTIAGSEEYRLAGYDQATGRVSYGKVGKLRAFGRRFGVG